MSYHSQYNDIEKAGSFIQNQKSNPPLIFPSIFDLIALLYRRIGAYICKSNKGWQNLALVTDSITSTSYICTSTLLDLSVLIFPLNSPFLKPFANKIIAYSSFGPYYQQTAKQTRIKAGKGQALWFSPGGRKGLMQTLQQNQKSIGSRNKRLHIERDG